MCQVPLPTRGRLSSDPRVLIFDDATSNLDQKTAEHLTCTSGSKGMLFIAHQLPRAERQKPTPTPPYQPLPHGDHA